MPTCSLVFVRRHIDDLPGWYYDLKICDWPLNLIVAQHGSWWYFPQVMGVHRLTTSSTWALQSQKRNINLVLSAYDQMIAGFSEKPDLVTLLKQGRRRFELFNTFPFLRFVYDLAQKSKRIF